VAAGGEWRCEAMADGIYLHLMADGIMMDRSDRSGFRIDLW
jgi:hypothetical protein